MGEDARQTGRAPGQREGLLKMSGEDPVRMVFNSQPRHSMSVLSGLELAWPYWQSKSGQTRPITGSLHYVYGLNLYEQPSAEGGPDQWTRLAISGWLH